MRGVTIDLASIVPSMRDFLQAIATRRKGLALVALAERADDAHALADAGVAAFACSAPTDAMRAVSAAIGSTPLLSLSPVTSEIETLTARAGGADAVVVDDAQAIGWDALAKHARTTRMAPLALVTDGPSAERAAKSTAKPFSSGRARSPT